MDDKPTTTEKHFISRYHYVRAVSCVNGKTYYATRIGVTSFKENKTCVLHTKDIRELKEKFSDKSTFKDVTVAHVNVVRKRTAYASYHYASDHFSRTTGGSLYCMIIWDTRRRQWNVTYIKDFENPKHFDTIEEVKHYVGYSVCQRDLQKRYNSANDAFYLWLSAQMPKV